MDRYLFCALAFILLASALIVGYYPLVGDEQLHAYAAFWSASTGLPAGNALQFNSNWFYNYPPVFPLLAVASVKAFGNVLGVMTAVRLVSVLSALALAVLAYAFTRKFFPGSDARLALAYAAATPFILSNSGLALITEFGLLAGLFFTFALLEFLERQTVRNALAAGVALGLALNTHFYFLTLVAVIPAVAAANAFLRRYQLDYRLLALALAVGVALGTPFYAGNYLSYGYLNGPSGPAQSTPGEGLIASFDAGVLYYDAWLSGINAYVHRDDAFERIDSLAGGVFPSKLAWLLLTGTVSLLVLWGLAVSAKRHPALALTAVLSLPPVYFGIGFWRYAGALPALAAVFFAVGATAAANYLPAGRRKWFYAFLAVAFAAMVVQTALTTYIVHENKEVLYSFIRGIPAKTDGEGFCQLQLRGTYLAPLPTLLTGEFVRGCKPAFEVGDPTLGVAGKWVLVFEDSFYHSREQREYLRRGVEGYSLAGSAAVPPVTVELWERVG